MEESIERAEIEFCEYRDKAVKALREQREASHKTYNASRTSYEEQIMNMNVSHQTENHAGHAERA
eukprot:3707421-Heterocapsa_arctica.AAC.1